MLLMFALALTLVANAALDVTAGGAKDKGKFKDLKFDGVLRQDDERDPSRNTPRKVHMVTLNAGQRYTIDMIGNGFDAYLRLEDKAGKELAEDDDSGGGLNAQIVFNCTKDGEYRVICTCQGNANGKYTLTVKAAGAIALDAAHASLLGKAAPDFDAAFALGGKAVRLADLKGKVVLLNFWTIQSGESVAAMSRLRELQKLHKDAGLAVVSVTYFNSELGHRLSFDPATGEIGRPDAANLTSDKAMFKDFAAYYKLDHLLLALHKDDAVKVFDHYLVNSMPQFVLIDRDGIVRFVCVGDAQIRNPDADIEIKKLLAPKK
jgi:peroxiredoxin